MAAWLEKLASKLPPRFQGMIHKKPPQEMLFDLLDLNDPRIVLQPLEAFDWMCPYCLNTFLAPSWDGKPGTLLAQDVVRDHLLQCIGNCSPKFPPQMKPWPIIVEAVVKLRLEQWPAYRVTNADGEWICPHCLNSTGVLRRNWDGSEAPAEWFLPAAHQHLKECTEYNKAPLTCHTEEQVKGTLGEHDIRKRLFLRIANDPIFRIAADSGAWLDPVTETLVEDINLTALPWGVTVQNKIVDYLMRPNFPGRRTNWRVSKGIEELNRLAGKLSAQKSSRHRSDTATGEELARLREKVGQLEASAENVQEIHRELAAARAVQIKLLPAKPPTIEGYEVSAFYESCSELGGDMFHFLPAGEGHMGFLIGDVSGHGVGAAMIMAGAMKSFVVRAKDQPSPTAVVVSVCKDLAPDIPPGRFVSAFYGVLERATGRFRYVRAGHNPPYLYEPRSRKIKELSATGLALGICRPEQFEPRLKEEEVTIDPGGILVLYTDGVVEAQNAEKALFGEERLQQIVQENASRSSRRIAEAIVTATRQHAGECPMEDDVTLVVIKRVAE